MKTKELHQRLLETLKLYAADQVTVASLLIDTLDISKESAYRRIRGEVSFSFDEVATISETLGISLDNIVDSRSFNSKPFQLRDSGLINPIKNNLKQLDDYSTVLHQSNNDQYTEVGSTATLLLLTHCLKCPTLTKYFILKWMYQTTSGVGAVKSLKDIVIPDGFYEALRRYHEGLLSIKYTFFIWDRLQFQYLVNDIKYFARINYITKNDVDALKDDLLDFVNQMEILAAKGRYESGNQLQFYLSGINFESSYTYLQTETLNISFVKIFSINSLVSHDKDTFDKLKQWISSLKRLSLLISESGEIERYRFFEEQKLLINTLLINK